MPACLNTPTSQTFLSNNYASYTWREDMRRDKENGDNPSRTLQYQVAKLLEKVGGKSANLHVYLDQRLMYEPGDTNEAD